MVEVIDNLCLATRANDASDLFLHEGRVPQIRLRGELMQIGEDVITADMMKAFWEYCGIAADAQDGDTSFLASDGGRFRVNVFRYLGSRGAVLRQIKMEIPSLESLHLPAELLQSWAGHNNGLVIVAGRTGSGKSTTLASTIQWLNENAPRHVVTIEDPIEYLFHNHLCLFTQRELGLDTSSFSEGLKRALRQSPDVILVGEIRDHDTAETALHAVETGHLVLTTLHSSSVTETIERLLMLFPQSDREGVQRLLGNLLVGILCQRLIPTANESVIPVCETFQNEGASRKYIMEGRVSELNDLLERSDQPANQTYLQALAHYVKQDIISRETATEYCDNPMEISRALRGISNSAGGVIRR